ncbi:apoptosis-associated speck-like protein containing a CARD [Pholidichthys leucotaenia]
MSDKPVKMVLVDTLEDLTEENFRKFCYRLQNRNEEPRVRRRRVEGKSLLEVVDVLVSHFSEDGAVQVAADILTAIGCRDEAQTLREFTRQIKGGGGLPRIYDLNVRSTNDIKQMAQKNNRIILGETLEDLRPEDFDKFCHYLIHCEDKKEPIRRRRVQGRNFLEVADAVVSHYAEDSLPVTVKILEQIGCREEAKELEKIMARASSSGSAGISAGAELTNAVEGGSDFVDKRRAQLIQRVTNVMQILDELLDRRVLTHENYSEIKAKSTNQERMRAIYHGPLTAGGRRAKDVFYECLKKLEPFLVEDLSGK